MHRLDQLHPPSDKRIATRVTRDAIRQLRSGHPWVYDGSITKVSHEGAPGDLAVIFDADRSFVAIGLYDPASPIRIKVLHCGKPTQIDDDFWLARVRSAANVRGSLAASDETTGYRCINGENDGLPGLILDRYDRSFVLKLYSSAWFPHLDKVCQAITSVFDPETMVLRMSRSVQAAETFGLSEGDALLGATPTAPVQFQEYGLTFEADIVQGQKTGHFLDQRDNRHHVGQLANHARVLDLFSCTGGFSVHAAAGGARSIVSVDQSAQALSTAETNMALNQSLPAVAQAKHRTIRGDVFEVLNSMPSTEQFEIVVVDPPSFAQKKASIAAGIRSYRRLTEAALQVVAPGGLLFQASCSSRISDEDFVATVTEGADRSGRAFTIVDQTGHGIDHPTTFAQGGYLKAVFLRVD